MALIACPNCGHNISSFARFCPKCSPLSETAEGAAPRLFLKGVSGENRAEQVLPQHTVFHSKADSYTELLQHEFSPSPDERIVLEGRTFYLTGRFRVLDCYAYLTSKRFVLCDFSRVNIVFQMARSGIAFVEEGRHLISKKLVITATSGETLHLKYLRHSRWLRALLEPDSISDASQALNARQLEEDQSPIDWHYESGGVNIGPVKEKLIVQLIRNNHTILRDTKVWNAGMAEWKRAEDTILTIYFGEPANSGEDSPETLLSPLKLLFRKYL